MSKLKDGLKNEPSFFYYLSNINIDSLLISVFEKAYPILEVLIELFIKNSNKEPPDKDNKKRLRKNERNRNK